MTGGGHVLCSVLLSELVCPDFDNTLFVWFAVLSGTEDVDQSFRNDVYAVGS